MGWYGSSYRGWKLRSWLADGIICQNKNMLQKYFLNWKKTKLIPIGVDTHEYKKKSGDTNLKKRWGIPIDSRIIISVSNLIPVKGVEVLIQAFELLSTNYKDWRLMIVGADETEYAMELKNLFLTKSKMKDKIIFTGRQNNVKELLDISEIYVQPSLSTGEGAPIAILEAMSNGKVIIGSDVPGIRDQLNDFPQHLFKAGNIYDLKNKLIEFISNDINENIKIGEKFIDFVIANYDMHIEKRRLKKYYTQLVNDLD